MGLLDGKRGVIFGIANERSYAWYIARQLIAHGADCCFSYMPIGRAEHRVGKAVESLGVQDPWLMPADASRDDQIQSVFDKLKADFGTIDFVVHSIAFADRNYLKQDTFHQTPREVFTQAMDISAYTLLAMARGAMDLMPSETGADGAASGGGSILGLSYYGGEKVVPGYNVMGVAKAALEHTTRYLAYELGSRNIRVNAISAGPLKTLAASGVGGIDEMIQHQQAKAALKRTNTGDEVGDTAVYLVSDLSTAVTGETIHVDAGFSIVGL